MDKTSQLYDKILDDYMHMRTGRVRRQVQNVKKLVDLGMGENILEVGVATGKFTSAFTRENKVVALDFSKDSLERCKRTVEKLGDINNLECVEADCSEMPFEDAIFDKVMAIDMIEHITDDTFRSFCYEASRVLKVGGKFYIYTPNLLHPFELARPFRPVLRKEHIGVRTRAKICRYLKNAGFEIVRGYFSNCFRRISVEAARK